MKNQITTILVLIENNEPFRKVLIKAMSQVITGDEFIPTPREKAFLEIGLESLNAI